MIVSATGISPPYIFYCTTFDAVKQDMSNVEIRPYSSNDVLTPVATGTGHFSVRLVITRRQNLIFAGRAATPHGPIAALSIREIVRPFKDGTQTARTCPISAALSEPQRGLDRSM